MIVNYASSGINKLTVSLNDDARVIIYDRHMFIVQATGRLPQAPILPTNITLKAVANTLDYHNAATITTVKRFIVQAQD
jgi:hypothetical protein